jgi:phosphatidylglycerol---prolipoprotein diacylglyceryl transferase
VLTPDPILVRLGPIPVYWYGVCYAVGLVLVYLIASREALRKGLDAELLTNGMIVIAVAALIGGRAYHVIDQWGNLYASDPIKVVLPPYTGLGVYGGLITGTLAAGWYIRRHRQPFWAWADVAAPALFGMQLAGRWGNFFNQELYGPPTNLPWGIPIECAHRIPAYPCDAFPFDATRFQPLFLYESLSGLVGLLVLLYLGRRFADRLRTGDLLGIFFVWYGVVRFGLESLRTDNWTFFGIPTAWLFSTAFIVAGLAILAFRRARHAGSMADEDAARRAAHASLPDDGPKVAGEGRDGGSPRADDAEPVAGAG